MNILRGTKDPFDGKANCSRRHSGCGLIKEEKDKGSFKTPTLSESRLGA